MLPRRSYRHSLALSELIDEMEVVLRRLPFAGSRRQPTQTGPCVCSQPFTSLNKVSSKLSSIHLQPLLAKLLPHEISHRDSSLTSHLFLANRRPPPKSTQQFLSQLVFPILDLAPFDRSKFSYDILCLSKINLRERISLFIPVVKADHGVHQPHSSTPPRKGTPKVHSLDVLDHLAYVDHMCPYPTRPSIHFDLPRHRPTQSNVSLTRFVEQDLVAQVKEDGRCQRVVSLGRTFADFKDVDAIP